jgi:hypothetical protein
MPSTARSVYGANQSLPQQAARDLYNRQLAIMRVPFEFCYFAELSTASASYAKLRDVTIFVPDFAFNDGVKKSVLTVWLERHVNAGTGSWKLTAPWGDSSIDSAFSNAAYALGSVQIDIPPAYANTVQVLGIYALVTGGGGNRTYVRCVDQALSYFGDFY